MLNAMFSCAIEPFIEDGVLKTRVLSAHQFLPYSDDKNNPLRPTVMIKLLGSEIEERPASDGEGSDNRRNEVIRNSYYGLFAKDEFLVIDEGGGIRLDKMVEFGIPRKISQTV